MAARKPQTYDDLYPGRFLKGGNFGDRKITLTIKDAVLEELEGEDGKKHKAILAFEETTRMHVMPKTNGQCLKAMFGNVLAGWRGKRVTLYQGEWNGEPCIRVWGSPDIERDLQVEVKLPRRKPLRMTMRKVDVAKSTTTSEELTDALKDEAAE